MVDRGNGGPAADGATALTARPVAAKEADTEARPPGRHEIVYVDGPKRGKRETWDGPLPESITGSEATYVRMHEVADDGAERYKLFRWKGSRLPSE